jgi:peptidoglycan-associated lipoprotein
MSVTRRLPVHPVALMLLLPVLGAANCNRKKAVVTPEEIGGGDPGTAQAITNRVTVVSVEPSTIAAGVPATIAVYGGGFQSGARVRVGGTQAERATTQSASKIEARLPGLAAGTYDVEVINPDGEASVLRSALRAGGPASDACLAFTVYFEFDSSTLRGDAVGTLTSKADCLAGATGPLLVEGHADERGPTDYNLALGERRADAVVRWLTSRGVAASRIRATSLGEERPANPGHDEAAWAENRRVEVKLER